MSSVLEMKAQWFEEGRLLRLRGRQFYSYGQISYASNRCSCQVVVLPCICETLQLSSLQHSLSVIIRCDFMEMRYMDYADMLLTVWNILPDMFISQNHLINNVGWCKIRDMHHTEINWKCLLNSRNCKQTGCKSKIKIFCNCSLCN